MRFLILVRGATSLPADVAVVCSARNTILLCRILSVYRRVEPPLFVPPYNIDSCQQESLRRRKFKGWPNGPDGQPALSEALDVKTASRSMAKRELSESTMDAMFDSFCGSPLSAIADRC